MLLDRKHTALYPPVLLRAQVVRTETAFPLDFWVTVTFIFAGIGMDTCVIPLRHGGLSLVQTTDYIYPIVDDPYMMVSLTPVRCHTGHCLLVGFGAVAGVVFVTPRLWSSCPAWTPALGASGSVPCSHLRQMWEPLSVYLREHVVSARLVTDLFVVFFFLSLSDIYRLHPCVSGFEVLPYPVGGLILDGSFWK